MILGMKHTKMGPRLLNALPTWLLRPLTSARRTRAEPP